MCIDKGSLVYCWVENLFSYVYVDVLYVRVASCVCVTAATFEKSHLKTQLIG